MRLSLWICWNRIIFIFLKRSFAAGTQYRMKCVWHLADFHSFCLGSCPVSGGPLGFTWPWCNRRFQLAQGQEGNPTLGGRDVRCAVHLESCSLKSNIDVTLWNVSNFLFPTLLSLTFFRLFSSDVGCFDEATTFSWLCTKIFITWLWFVLTCFMVSLSVCKSNAPLLK